MVETFTSDFLISKLNKSIYLQRERKILALSTKFSIFSSIFSKVKTLKILFVINIRKRNDRLCRFIQVTETTLKVLFMRFFLNASSQDSFFLAFVLQKVVDVTKHHNNVVIYVLTNCGTLQWWFIWRLRDDYLLCSGVDCCCTDELTSLNAKSICQ